MDTVETDFLIGEGVEISMDVYNMTIAASLSGDICPKHLTYCLKQCMYVFIIQIVTVFYFSYEFMDFARFQKFEIMPTALRLIASTLLH